MVDCAVLALQVGGDGIFRIGAGERETVAGQIVLRERLPRAAAQRAPARIVYVSCNPETLARDLRYLTKHGYKAEEAWGYDMFAWSEHVETVCLLTQKKA